MKLPLKDTLHAPNAENLCISEKYPTWGGGIGWGIDRWVGTIDNIVLKMGLEHETTP